MSLFKRRHREFLDTLQQTLAMRSKSLNDTVDFPSDLTPDQVDRGELGKLFGLMVLPVLQNPQGSIYLAVSGKTATWSYSNGEVTEAMSAPPWRVAKALVEELTELAELSTDRPTGKLELKLDDRIVALQIEKEETPDGTSVKISRMKDVKTI